MKIYYLFFVLLFFYACEEKPIPLSIPEDKMIDVLVDVHFAESAMNNIYKHKKDSLATLYYGQIFEIHGINQNVFDENMQILQRDADKLDAVYEQVLERLNKKGLEVQKNATYKGSKEEKTKEGQKENK